MDGARAQWSLPLDTAEWSAQPKTIPGDQLPRALRIVDGPEAETATAAAAWSAAATETGVRFEIAGGPPFTRQMRWSTPILRKPEGPYTHYSLRYRARGIARSSRPFPVIAMVGRNGEGEAASASILGARDTRNDDRWHTVTGQLGSGVAAEAVEVQLSTTDSSAAVEIGELSLHREAPEVAAELGVSGVVVPQGSMLRCLDLSEQFNDTCTAAWERMFARQQMVIDGGTLPGAGAVVSGQIAFSTNGPDSGMIRPPGSPDPNGEKVEFAGISVSRQYMEPVGRDDVIRVPVNRNVSEVFMVLVAEMPGSHQPYASSPQPFQISDIGGLSVQLRYADGTSDLAFPYSLADGGFLLQRGCGAYAVVADAEKELSEIAVHNHVRGSDFCVAAVTVNTSTNRVMLSLAEEPAPLRVKTPKTPAHRPAAVTRDGDRVTLSNRFYEMVLNCERGLAIESVRHHRTDAPVRLSPSSGIELQNGDTVLTGRAFTTQSVVVEGSTLTVTLTSARDEFPLELTAVFTVGDSPGLQTHLTVANRGDQPGKWSVRFPVLREASVGEIEDTWVFFPQYRLVNTNGPGLYTAPYDLHFPAQVMDLYNPGAGAGLGVLTRNLDNTSLDYGMSKGDRGAAAWIEYPAAFHPLEPGESRRLTDTVLLFHGGDWHEAVAAYQDWQSTWFTPPARDTEWFQDVFALRCHQTKKFYSWAIPIYDAETGEYRIEDFMAGDQEYLGLKPDLFHLFGWIDLENSWHGHPNGDFDPANYTGGAEALTGAVTRLQEGLGIPASLYTLSDRCLKASEVGKRLGPDIVRIRADGSRVEDEANYYICPCSTEWHDHYSQALKRTQETTGVEAIYVDVFGYPRTSACYSAEHGHPVPCDANAGCLDLLKKIRAALPGDVAIWSEYPVNDVAYQYLDGNIHYYCLYWHQHFSKLYDRVDAAPQAAPAPVNLGRYVFPGVKQLVFLCGSVDWSMDARFPFFNGEGLYDTSWFLYASPHLDRIRKSLRLQKEYADCFTADGPEPLVATERLHVYANRFPGEGRTVWTLYNARYTTVRGPVLRVPHVDGASYYDAWNGEELAPRIDGNQATISLDMGPQDLGCVVQRTTGED